MFARFRKLNNMGINIEDKALFELLDEHDKFLEKCIKENKKLKEQIENIKNRLKKIEEELDKHF